MTEILYITRFHDPAHGWYRIPLWAIEKARIADQISRFSYRDSQFAYLEEDSDMGKFLKAWETQGGEPIQVGDSHHQDKSFVRDLDYF